MWTDSDPWPGAEEEPEPPVACPHCQARNREPHDESCPLFSPADDPTTAEGRARYRMRQAERASPEQVMTWLRSHAKGMAINSHARLYIERAILLIEAKYRRAA